MAMQQQFQRSLKSIFILSLITIISACGSDDKKPPTPSDSTPTAFSFTAVTGAAVSSEVTSSAVTIVGIDKASTISITGGTYAIGTGAFTSKTGTITTGQTVKVKVMTSASNSTAVTTTLTIGEVIGSFNVTTIAADATPDAFVLPAVTGVQPNSVNTSAVVTVAGINVTVPISITGGEYSINGGTYTSVAGTVSAAETVTVRTTAAAAPSAAKDAVLTIGGVGGVSATYKVTTIADVLAPTAQILFPPIVSMTEGNTILVRGSASDAYSIKSVKVNGVTATTTDSFANWQALVPLTDTTTLVTATTENTITVVTEDNAGNIATDAARVSIRQAPITSAFPDSDNLFEDARAFSLDQVDGRNRLLVAGGNQSIKSVDLSTGNRTIFAQLQTQTARGVVLNSIDKRFYAVVDQNIVDFDLANGSSFVAHTTNFYSHKIGVLIIDSIGNEMKIISADSGSGAIASSTKLFTDFTVLSNAATSTPDALNPITQPWGIALDKTRARYLVTDLATQTIYTVNPSTGVRSVFSNNTTGSGDPFAAASDPGEDNALGVITVIVVDEITQRAIVAESGTGNIFAIDLATGNRSIISSNTSPNTFNKVKNIYGMAIYSPNSYIFVSNSDGAFRGIVAIDLVTGRRVVVSK